MKNQELKLQLLKEYYSRGIEFVRDAYKFVTEDEEPQPQNQLIHTVDGVFYVYPDGTNEPFINGNKPSRDDCVGIAIQQGCRSIVVALHDMSDDDNLTLTTGQDTTNLKAFYREKPIDANADWQGMENTEHLKKIGLNPEIKLEDGWFIPSMGQMRFIHCHLRELNEALVKAGGDPLECENKPWYWTSTESSATNAWFLYLYSGGMDSLTKASNQNRVRAVSAFIS